MPAGTLAVAPVLLAIRRRGTRRRHADMKNMTRVRLIYGCALATAALVLASGAAGATSGTLPTTTTTTPTSPPATTTTLKPPKTSAFSPATTACIKQATAMKKTCKVSAAVVDCKAEFETAFANCFAAGNGVACATSCETAKTSCETPALAAEKTCLKTCKSSEKATIAGCQLTSPNCVTNAVATSLTCKKACAQAPALVACHTNFAACLTKCPNL